MALVSIELFTRDKSPWRVAIIHDFKVDLALLNSMLRRASYMIDNYNKNLINYVDKVDDELIELRMLEMNDIYGKKQEKVPERSVSTKQTVQCIKTGTISGINLDNNMDKARGVIYLDCNEYLKEKRELAIESRLQIDLPRRIIGISGLSKVIDIKEYQEKISKGPVRIENFTMSDLNFNEIPFNRLDDAIELSSNLVGWVHPGHYNRWIHCPIPAGYL